MSGVIFVNTMERDATGIQHMKTKHAVKHPMMHRAARIIQLKGDAETEVSIFI